MPLSRRFHLNKKNSRILAAIILAVFFIITVTVIYLNRPKQFPKEAHSFSSISKVIKSQNNAQDSPTPQLNSQFRLNNFHRSQVKNGRTVWNIVAEVGEYFPQSSTIDLVQPLITLFRENGEIVTLKANSAEIKLNKDELSTAQIKGDVIIKYLASEAAKEAKFTITGEEAVYDKASGTVISQSAVHLVSERMDVTGSQLYAQVEEQIINIKKNVKTSIKPRQKGT
jgi:LPS export ABC transporter protein LptC